MDEKKDTLAVLRAIIEEDKHSVEARVAQDALDHELDIYDEQDVPGAEAIRYLRSVTRNGCASGVCSGLVYYADTEEFFREFQGEAEAVLEEYEDNTGEGFKFNGRNVPNTLAWMLYEETAGELLEKIEEDND